MKSRHLGLLLVSNFLLVSAMIYPCMPGRYDHLALPISTLTQVFGLGGLLLVPAGILWLIAELRRSNSRTIFAFIALGAGVIVALILIIVAFAASGWLLALAFIPVSFFVLKRLPARRNINDVPTISAPSYLIVLPMAALVLQLILAAPLRDASRSRAIANASELIAEIEGYREDNGNYPESLLSVWKDYSPGVVGIEAYYYAPTGGSYNLVFEQPRFLLDDLGAREFVVFSPDDNQSMISHDSWILFFSPADLLSNQGWYSRQTTGSPGWVSFLFD
jgi:hypothetical protein